MNYTSIIKVGSNLIATIPADVNDAEAMDLQIAVNEKIESTGVSGVLIDISALDTVDSFLGRLLHDLAIGARLLGSRTVIAGMQPAVAMTLVELGLQLGGIQTALDAERGLKMLQSDGWKTRGR